MDMVHDYRDDGCGEVEAVDECPKCGTEDVEESKNNTNKGGEMLG